MKKLCLILSLLPFYSFADLLPLAASYDGVGGIYGAAYSKQFEGGHKLLIGAATGDLTAFGGLYTKVLSKDLEFSIGALSFDQVSLTTTYERGLLDDEDNRYILNFSGNAIAIGSKYWTLEDHLLFGFSATQSTIVFDNYENDSNEEIDLAGANLFDIETTEIKISLNARFYDNQRAPNKGVGLTTSLSQISGRTGQSDQMLLNYGANGLYPLNKIVSLKASVQYSDAIVDVNKKYDTENEIRDALDADCDSISDANDKAECEKLADNLVDYILQNNLYGTAAPIGGSSGPRSFRQFRFKAAHTALYIAEVKTSLSELFGILNKKGADLSFVVFYDQGFANDDKKFLFDESKFSNGAALRFQKGNNSVNLQAASGSDDSSSWSLSFGTAI